MLYSKVLRATLILLFAGASSVGVNDIYANEFIPSSQSGFYYEIGGGNDVPMPAFYDTSYLPLDTPSDVGWSFNCGAFSWSASLTNALNQIKSSAIAIKGQVIRDATGAITELPMYELARTDGSLYNLLTDDISSSEEGIRFSTKSCQEVQSEIGAGQNPYAHWGKLAMGNQWQTEIGTAELTGNGDVNQARNNVSTDAGKQGIPWVNPASTALNQNSRTYAGGVGQPPIHVIHDTAAVGYNIILQDAASSQMQNHRLGSSNAVLTSTWKTPKAAANWIANVVGDETITTYNSGGKSAKPGVGLYPDIQYQMQQIKPKLQALIAESQVLPNETLLKNLQAISPQGIALSPDMIHSIKSQSKVMQAIMIDKLSQNIAALNVIDKARLAMRILQSGARKPAIYSNGAAQKTIQQSVSQLQKDVQNILLFVNAKQALASNIMSTIMQQGQSQALKNTAIAMPKPNAPFMKQGAISAK